MNRPPPDEDITAFLSAEKANAPEAPEAMARVRLAVEGRIALLGPGGGGGGDNGGTRRGNDARGSSGGSLPIRGWLAHPVLLLSGAFVLGGALVGVVSPRPAPQTQIVYLDRVVAAAPAAAPATASAAAAAMERQFELPEVPLKVYAVSAAPQASAIDGRGLAAERALLDLARSSVARGEGSEALAAIDRHQKDFPHGLLVEEREALAVKALVLVQRYDEARARGARFRVQFPRSLSLVAVNATLEAIP